MNGNNPYAEVKSNPFAISLTEVPILDYPLFFRLVDALMAEKGNHCLTYFAYPFHDRLRMICCIGLDRSHAIRIFSYEWKAGMDRPPDALTTHHPAFHGFERELYENHGVPFTGHPWMKPVRYPADRHHQHEMMDNYPFYTIEGEELHEVGVGPIHAGVIEPGYFRFICHGETVFHLEIQLGYQHRGVEKTLTEQSGILKGSVLSESIAGDTAVGHSLAYALLTEALGSKVIGERLSIEREIALEMERIAVHIGDMAALCNDVAYQLGQVVNEALRTLIINTTQRWCGNRFGKGLIRPCGTRYPLTPEMKNDLLHHLEEVESRFNQITDRIFSMPSVLGRFEAIGKVTEQQALSIGAVGMAARSSGLARDTRWSHPTGSRRNNRYEPVVIPSGDVWARAQLRKLEVGRSITMIRELTRQWEDAGSVSEPCYAFPFQPGTLAVSLTEGWRGEICHAAVTGNQGELLRYKVKDPSFHNWTALALAVRNQEISDFPLCNKSYNLSYCGHDL